MNQEESKRLMVQLQYLEKNSPYYKAQFEQLELSFLGGASIFKVEEFQALPLTTKEDLQRENDAFLCVPKTEIIDYVTTSGTLGNPVTFALNENDLQRLATNECLSFRNAGVQKKDTVQIATTLDRRFMAGMAYFLGLRKLGAGTVRVGAGAPGLQWDSIRRFRPTYLVVVPSFLLKLASYAEDNGIYIGKSSIKAAVCIGEPLRNEDFTLNTLGQKIKTLWDIELYSTYASTEMSTAFTECSAHQGGHVLTDLIYTEVLDENGNPVKEGEIGELVVTTLGVETMPLLRYATGDMLRLHTSLCSCGNPTPRVSPVLGRKKQQIKLKGTTFYPQHIKEVLASFNSIEHYCIEVDNDENGLDKVEIKIPSNTAQSTQKLLSEQLRAALRVVPSINLHPKEDILRIKFPEESRKPVDFIDKRKK